MRVWAGGCILLVCKEEGGLCNEFYGTVIGVWSKQRGKFSSLIYAGGCTCLGFYGGFGALGEFLVINFVSLDM